MLWEVKVLKIVMTRKSQRVASSVSSNSKLIRSKSMESPVLYLLHFGADSFATSTFSHPFNFTKRQLETTLTIGTLKIGQRLLLNGLLLSMFCDHSNSSELH